MTREEQIKDIAGKICNVGPLQRMGFVEGAQWADLNPIDEASFVLDLIHQRSIAFDEARDAREKLVAMEQDHLIHWHDLVVKLDQLKFKLEKAESCAAELAKVLEGFQLGHEHAPDLSHTRAMGDSYGWCDYCHTKVSWGPGEAEKALAAWRKAKGEEK